MFPFRFLPCPECGEAVDRTSAAHSCRADRLLAADRRLLADMETFEYEVHRYLDTPEGKLEAWVASRRVRRSR